MAYSRGSGTSTVTAASGSRISANTVRASRRSGTRAGMIPAQMPAVANSTSSESAEKPFRCTMSAVAPPQAPDRMKLTVRNANR